jgi:hypothetical protein
MYRIAEMIFIFVMYACCLILLIKGLADAGEVFRKLKLGYNVDVREYRYAAQMIFWCPLLALLATVFLLWIH